MAGGVGGMGAGVGSGTGVRGVSRGDSSMSLLPPLRPGLVLNMSSRSWYGRLIRLVLARSWAERAKCPNHDALVVEWEGKLWVGDTQPPVARLTSLESYERDLASGKIYRLRVLAVAGACQAEERAASRWWLDNARNRPYDYMAFPRLLWKALVGDWWKRAAGWEWAHWCTEGVADAWRKGAKRDPWMKLNPTPLTTWTRWQEGKFTCIKEIVR